MALISALGQGLRDIGLQPVIAGRGWPAVPGWTVDEGFMTEEAMTARLRRAHCLLLPYSHYFQSNVAVRALELGTPVVGHRHPFLEGLLGLDYPGYVQDGDGMEMWIRAIERSIAIPPRSLAAPLEVYESRVIETWSTYLRQGDGR
jgi:hypothetical protein